MLTSRSLADLRVTVRCSGELNNRDKKRTSDNLGSNKEPNSKRLKNNNEKPKDEEEKEHPVVQSGLYATEMMTVTAHVVQQNVISSIIKSKSSKRQTSIALISRAGRHLSRLVF